MLHAIQYRVTRQRSDGLSLSHPTGLRPRAAVVAAAPRRPHARSGSATLRATRQMDGPRSRHSSLAPLVLLLCLVPRASGLATPAPDFSLLSRRIASQQADEATVQCLLLDAMLPRQRLTFQFGPPVSTTLSEVRKEKGMLAVVGINPRTGDVLKRGVEARIESMSP